MGESTRDVSDVFGLLGLGEVSSSLEVLLGAGLVFEDLLVLMVVASGVMLAGDVARTLGIALPVVRLSVERLVECGWLVRCGAAGDQQVSLTQDGNILLERAIGKYPQDRLLALRFMRVLLRFAERLRG